MGIEGADSTRTAKEQSGTLTADSAVQTAGMPEWLGNECYDVVRRIGEGGMGVVYEAFDRERVQTVALKSLLHFTPAALYRFKQEFRTLADVHHPNLVRLYELIVAEGNNVFFTMELVSGTDFLTYVQKPGTRRDKSGETRSTLLNADIEPGRTVGPPADAWTLAGAPRQTSPADLDRLRGALRQLVEGLMALHAAGKLHRDIKPSNVLVREDGRVVILDFGVATDLSPVVDGNLSEELEVVGTVRYMSPEQATTESPTAASDWYSVGVVLYEALVGWAPFAGPAATVLTMKMLHDPVPPAECVEGVPPDLDSLCRALLDREAGKRPTGAEVLRRLGPMPRDRSAASPLPVAARAQATALVGRDRQIAALRDGFHHVLSGHSVTIRIAGGSGMGKSAIAEHFLDQLVERGEAVVLRGRAYERESVPYKAVDSVVDALSSYLFRLEEVGDRMELPADMGALARVFPVLRRVTSIQDVADVHDSDPSMVRRRAFAALRELLRTLASRRPLVIYIDDVQWGDADSAALLLQLVRPPESPPVLFVMTHRDEEAEASSFLKELRDRWPRGAEERHISVGPLDADDADRFALSLFDSSHPMALTTAREVARESRGSPFLIEELVRSHLSVVGAPEGPNPRVLSLGDVVGRRLERLPADARLLLEIVAVGGRPLPVSLVAQAFGSGDAVDKAIEDARARRFLRTGFRGGHEVVETSHDRFRETIVAQLSESKLREHHGRLARVLEATSGADPEAVAVHLLGAGETERGGRFAQRAAERAAELLAFDQAARLYRLAIDTLPRSPKLGAFHARLGEVLGWAGRNEEAGRAYITAAEKTSGAERATLERAASAQLLAAGRIDEGGMMLRRVLAGAGVKVPRTPLGTLLSLLAYKTWLRLSTRFVERDAGEVAAADRARIDALHVAALGLASVDAVLANCMQARQLVEALRAGDRARVVRAATTYYGSHLAQVGGRLGAHEREIYALIQRLVEKGGSADEAAFSQGMHGVGLVLRGRWREATQVIDAAFANVANQQASMQPQIALYGVYALVFLGDLIELRRRQARLLADAERRGDRFMSIMLTLSHPVVLHLAADDPHTARTQLRDAKARWSHGRYLVQDWQVMRSEAEVELYAGDGAAAYERLRRDKDALDASLLLRVQFIRALTAFVRGRAAVAASEAVPRRRSARLAEARAFARRLARERMEWTAPLAALVTAAVKNAEGDRHAAARALEQAVVLADAADMSLYAAAARHQLGLRVGGAGGADLVLQAETVMRGQAIRVPSRFASMLVPGSWGPSEAQTRIE